MNDKAHGMAGYHHLCRRIFDGLCNNAYLNFQVRGEAMENWYKPGPVKVTRVEPDPRPRKPKPSWQEYNDIMDYQAKLIEKVRRRIDRTKHR